jgi:two-component system, chemotaxis family, protein-glutamate methylesterase/glutaminase
MVTVLIVDDSAFARLSITKQLGNDPEIHIVGYACDGIEAVEKTKALEPQVVTLDVAMPRMNGLEALSRIMIEKPTPVVMLSSLTGEGTEITIRALELGAFDYHLKTPHATSSGFFGLDESLNSKIKLAASIGMAGLKAKKNELPSPPPRMPRKLADIPRLPPTQIIVIGSSTGGPGALYEVIPRLPADIPAGILLVQHMPPGFTKSLADRLNDLSNITVKEAQEGDSLMQGHALLAPGNYHLEVKMNNRVAITQRPPVLGLRPSVDVTMLTASLAYGASTIGVVLTGMGSDGTKGSASIKAAGGRILAQDQASCVVYGMPRSVAESGHVDMVVPLKQMADVIMRVCQATQFAGKA